LSKKGCFITFEGGEGCGKSTQIKRLEEFLKQKNKDIVATREPGGSQGGEAIRKLLVQGDVKRWDDVTETLLFYAARRDHLINKIHPALNEGKWVLSDRFADSTTAYQAYGYSKNINVEKLNFLYDMVAGDFKPDLTIILDLPVEKGLKRAFGRGGDEERFENMDIKFHQNLRKAFLDIAKKEPDRCCVINADASIEEISNEINAIVTQRLGHLL
jgi:dTMP kinase